MSLLNLFASQKEQQNNLIGKVECGVENLEEIFIGLLRSMSMFNPPPNTILAKKFVSIEKKGNTYTLYLYLSVPPRTITWTSPLPLTKLTEMLDKIADNKKVVGWINMLPLEDQNKLFQLGVG